MQPRSPTVSSLDTIHEERLSESKEYRHHPGQFKHLGLFALNITLDRDEYQVPYHSNHKTIYEELKAEALKNAREQYPKATHIFEFGCILSKDHCIIYGNAYKDLLPR